MWRVNTSGTIVNASLKSLALYASKKRRATKQLISAGVDALLVVFCLWAAYSLRLGEFFTNLPATYHLFLILLPFTIAVYTRLGVYKWVVRSSNIGLYVQLVKAGCVAALILLATMYLLPPSEVNPRSLFLIFGLLLLCSTVAVRVIWRLLFDAAQLGAPVAIYGAGAAGSRLAAMLMTGSEYRPVCFVDDNPDLYHSTVLGLRVLPGNEQSLRDYLSCKNVSQVIIAIPSLASSDYANIVNRIQRSGFPYKTIPSIAELVSGKAQLGEIRDITINDIVGRNEITSDVSILNKHISGKSILVAGGGGSIGSELCRQIIRLNPRALTVVDNGEANLYHLNEQITAELTSMMDSSPIEFEAVLCSVTDSPRIMRLFAERRFDTVYHAAAYKHVPIVEAHPEQGINVNVFGTLNLLNAAIATNTSDFVLISTDKAVRPANVMGKTKRVAELILQAKAREQTGTRISMVRFGNVLDSTGSVVPKFRKQIEAGGPVTLTDSQITRYFMTIPEAACLVLQASAIAKGGDVFVLDMGDPVSIQHLAEAMIGLKRRQVELAGGVAPDIEIEITGLRPGEKMYEELFIGDNCVQTPIEKVLSADERYLEWEILDDYLKVLDTLMQQANSSATVEKLSAIVGRADYGQVEPVATKIANVVPITKIPVCS